jgi:hypothetical protein
VSIRLFQRASLQMPVELQCVKEGSKLRIRITAYITDTGVRHENVYNNHFNCRFPRHLRVEGRNYLVRDCNVKLLGGGGVAYYYGISAKDILHTDSSSDSFTTTEGQAQTQAQPQAPPQTGTAVARVFEVSSECIVCMDAPATAVFAPCGHFCACQKCCIPLQKCCICRAVIHHTVPHIP